MAVYPAGNEAFLTPNVITPQHYNVFAGRTQDAAIDTAALKWAVSQAVAAGNGTVYLGSGDYVVNEPIGVMITSPIAIIGDGFAQCNIKIDPSMTGNLISFSNTWYGSDVTTLPGGSAGNGTSLTAVKRPGRSSRKNGLRLFNFRIEGDRETANVQNGVILYDRNDNAHIHLQIEFIRGIGICLSGMPSNAVSNASSVMRESDVKLYVRWCGDHVTARPAVMLNSTDRGAGSSDDACNYVNLEALIAFSDGVGFQTNCYNVNANQFSNNTMHIIVDSPQNMSTASVNLSKASITNGVLTIASGGTITGAFAVGQYLDNASVPLGVYISEQLTGVPGAEGTYQLANNTLDISTLTVASGGNMSTLRCDIPFMQSGGGHVGDRMTVINNGSNTAGTGSPGITFNHNVLHASTAKTQACELHTFTGAIDLGVMFTVVGSLTWRPLARSSVTTATILNCTVGLDIDVGPIGSSNDLALGGDLSKVHVYPGGQKVVTALPANAAKWPNCELFLRSGSTHTRYISDSSSWLAT